MNRSIIFSLLIRLLGVFGWSLLIGMFLYLPSFVYRVFDAKTLNILAWPTVLNKDKLYEFEKQTGIKVNLTYFENNEELFVKLKSGHGDYDLIIPSDYGADLLIKNGLVKKIDKNKLTFYNDIHPYMKNLYYDPTNEYSLPFSWSVLGLGYNKSFFQHKFEPSWKMIFDESKIHYSIGMLDDARESIILAAYYLFKEYDHLSTVQKKLIVNLLLKQKKQVTMYTDLRADYLLASGTAPIVVTTSAEVFRTKRTYPFVDFAIPHEGTFALIDTICIPQDATNEYLYEFLNYLYQPEIILYYLNLYGLFSPLSSVVSRSEKNMQLDMKDLFTSAHFFHTHLSEKEFIHLWLMVKS